MYGGIESGVAFRLCRIPLSDGTGERKHKVAYNPHSEAQQCVRVLEPVRNSLFIGVTVSQAACEKQREAGVCPKGLSLTPSEIRSKNPS